MNRNAKLKEFFTSSQMIIVYIMIVLCIAIGSANAAFVDFSTVVTIARASLVTLIFAICEMLVIVSGGIDVSFPAIGCAAMYIPISFMIDNNIDSVIFAFVFAIVIGLIFGVINALLISTLQIPPLIATLGMSSFISGGLVGIWGATQLSILPSSVDAVFRSYLFTVVSHVNGNEYPLTSLIIIPIVLAVGIWALLKYTTLGRGIFAVGGNRSAAAVAGFNVKRIQYFVYIFVGGMTGIAAMTQCILNRAASSINLMGSEMMVIAAVVLGGTRLTGGHGTVSGTILGVLLISLIQNNLIMLGVPTHWQTFILGLLIVVGTSITSLKAKAASSQSKV